MTPLTKIMWSRRHEPVLTARVRWWAASRTTCSQRSPGRSSPSCPRRPGTACSTWPRATGTRWRSSWRGSPRPAAAGPADDGDPRPEPTRSRPGSGCRPACRWSSARATGRWATSGPARWRPASSACRSGRAARCGWSSTRPTLDPAGRLFCYALTDTLGRRWCDQQRAASSSGGPARCSAGLGRRTADRPTRSCSPSPRPSRPAATGLLMLPYLLAERAPLWDPDLAGAYLGLRIGPHPRALRPGRRRGRRPPAVDDRRGARPDRAGRPPSVRPGDVPRSVLWRRVLAAALGRPVTVTGGAEGSALGVAALGLVGAGPRR